MTRRPRRTFPALLVALVLLALGALAATSAVQTLLGRTPLVALDAVPGALSGLEWRSPTVLIAAAVAAVVGLALLLAALLPGSDHVVPLSGGSAGTVLDGGWHRRDLALRLRRRAQRLEGVTSAAATVRRRRVTVTARTHRDETAAVRDALASALSGDLDTLGLAHRPRVRVRVASTRKER